MKKPNVQKASFMLLIVCLLFSISVTAQKINTWKGGKTGHPNAWDCAQNWSLNAVPNEFQDVVIPDVSSGFNQYPVIDDAENVVRSITICSHAQLTIMPSGTLSVMGFGDASGYINQGRIIGYEYLILEYDLSQDTAATASQKP